MERAGTIIAALLGVLSFPVMLLNFGGGIVGGIWLLIIGNWSLLGLGVFSMFVSSFLLGLVLAPGLVFTAPAALAFQNGRQVIGSLCALIGNLYTSAIMTIWCVGCFYVVLVSYYRGGSIWPYLLWAYGMATGPWTYMAAREGRDAIGSSLSAFGACIGAIAIMGTLLVAARPNLTDIGIAFCIPLLIVIIGQFSLAFLAMREEARAF